MDSWLVYLLRVSLVFSVLFGIYLLLLRNNSFFRLQRIFLLSVLVISFTLPLIHISIPEVQKVLLPVRTFAWVFSPPSAQETATTFASGEAFNLSLLLLYLIPIFILGGILGIRLIRLSLISADRRYILSSRIRVVISRIITTPFSFMNHIYLNPAHFRHADYNYILLHETGHIREKHSIDIMISELARLVLWFCPVIWIYCTSIREIHEHLADKYALSTGIDKIIYQEIIVRHATGFTHFSNLAHGFSRGILKRRIMMISQKSTPSIHRLRFLIIIPMITLFLFLFGNIQARGPATDFNLPIHEGHVSSRYGDRIHPITGKKVFHRGIDIAAKSGIAVYASAPGIVTETGYQEKSGNFIIIAHTDSFGTFYSQLSEILIHQDTPVTSTTIIGRVGSSGLSTGPHLHFELRSGRKYIDPEEKIDFSSLTD